MQSLNKILSSNTYVISIIRDILSGDEEKSKPLELTIYSVMDRLPEFLSFEYSDKTDGGPHCNNGLSGWYYFLPAWISTTTAENERYYYITQENVYTTFTMPNRENRQLHPLEPNSYCPPTFPFVRTYGWLCTDLETVSSRELKTLDEYVTVLRKLYKDCEFDGANKDIPLKLFKHCKSNQLRRRA